MDAVIEIHVIRKIMNPNPADGGVGAKARANGLKHGSVVPDLRVAVHAGLGRRDVRELRIFDRSMAITAVNAEPADMVLVAERHGLLDRHLGPRGVSGTVQLGP